MMTRYFGNRTFQFNANRIMNVMQIKPYIMYYVKSSNLIALDILFAKYVNSNRKSILVKQVFNKRVFVVGGIEWNESEV